MDANEFRAEIAGIFREQDRRMEKHDQKIESNARLIEANARSVEANVRSIEANAQAITKMTELWGDFVDTFSIRDSQKSNSIEELRQRIIRLERKMGLS